MGLAIFSFNCLTNFFSVATVIKHPNVRRLRKVFVRSFTILLSFLIIVGICGYLSIGDQNIDLIIYRPKIGSSDYMMEIGRGALIISLFFNGGINAIPLKLMIGHSLKWDLESNKNYLLSFLFVIFPVLLASMNDSISDYVSITGCFMGSLLCFTFPYIMALKIKYFKNHIMEKILIVWTVFLTILCLFCTYFTALRIF